MAARRSTRALAPSDDEAKPARNLGPLRRIWGLAARYPRQVLTAQLARLEAITDELAAAQSSAGSVIPREKPAPT